MLRGQIIPVPASLVERDVKQFAGMLVKSELHKNARLDVEGEEKKVVKKKRKRTQDRELVRMNNKRRLGGYAVDQMQIVIDSRSRDSPFVGQVINILSEKRVKHIYDTNEIPTHFKWNRLEVGHEVTLDLDYYEGDQLRWDPLHPGVRIERVNYSLVWFEAVEFVEYVKTNRIGHLIATV